MDEFSKSFSAAEGMVDAEESTRQKRHNELCLNCGAKLAGPFCHQCGQKDIPKRQSLGELFSNFISGFLNYEGKFLRTAKYLITRPGFLAKEYNSGRRETYYHPARMYVFISFVFFLLFFSLSDKDKKNSFVKTSGDENQPELKEAKVDSLLKTIPGMDSASQKFIPKSVTDSIKKAVKKKKKKSGFSLGESKFKTTKEYDSIQQTISEEKRDGWWKRKMTIRSIELNERYKDDTKSFGQDFGKAFMNNFSNTLFFLLPIFALLLKLFYIRKDIFYSEHLVFSIYYYNFFYLAGSVYMLANLVPALSWIPTLIGLWIYFYLLFAMKKMYEQGWPKTVLKFLLFSFLFFIFLGIGLAINGFVILMMI